MLAVALVTFVVFLALGDVRAALVPAVVVPVSLIGTFSGMYLLGFSLDNLSLMALTIATGFVVDDAIVVLENISRHVENGMPRHEAALRGAKEVGFTVISISVSLVAVFIPILLMGGIVGRLFREFTATLVAGDRHLHGDLAHHDAHDVRAGSCACRSRAHGRTRRSLSIARSPCTSARSPGRCATAGW